MTLLKAQSLLFHNAGFDIGFLNHELRHYTQIGKFSEVTDHCTVLDTLKMARTLHPGQRNSLDALCKRYSVDNRSRQLHGALLDAQILAQVYLAMTGGQKILAFNTEDTVNQAGEISSNVIKRINRKGLNLTVQKATHEELAAHQGLYADVAGESLKLEVKQFLLYLHGTLCFFTLIFCMITLYSIGMISGEPTGLL